MVRAVSEEQHRMSFCLRGILEGIFGIYGQKSMVWKESLMVFISQPEAAWYSCALQLLRRQTQSSSRKTEWLGLRKTPTGRQRSPSLPQAHPEVEHSSKLPCRLPQHTRTRWYKTPKLKQCKKLMLPLVIHLGSYTWNVNQLL